MSAPDKTAARELVDAAGTFDRMTRIGGTPWTAPDRRTFHSVPQKNRRRRQLKRRSDSAYINGGSLPMSRGWVNPGER